MLKSVFFAFTLVVIAAVHAKPEPPAAEVHTHHYHTHTTTVKHQPQKQQKHGKQQRDRHSQQEQPHWQQYQGEQQQQPQQVKIRQSGPSKIFGWLGSRFAKIPHYLPRFPQFPKNPSPQKQQHQNQHQHQQPSYHAIILPDPPKPAGHGKVKSPQKVKLTQVTEVYEQPQVSPYLEVAANSAVQHNTYAPLPVSVTSYTVPNTAQQIEVVPSTLLYSDKQVFHPQQQQQQQQQPLQAQQYQSSTQYKHIAPAPAPIAAPPLQYTQYSAPQVSYNAIPAPVQKPQVFAAQGYKQPQAGTVPVVPQSTGPDYFDTAYRGATEQQVGYQIVSAKQQEQQQQQVLLSPENNYGATYEIQSQGVPQVYDSSVNLGGIGGPVISSASQQASYSSAPAQTSYTSIQQYANQALSSQQLQALSSSIADSGAVNQEQNIYAQYSQLSPSIAQAPAQGQDANQQGQSGGGQQQQYVYQYQTQEPAESQNQPQLSDTPGVQILSQSTDGGNPVFEVIADANAPDYNGHPFDINKLISMIEPGAQLESAELSHAASETKTTYMAPASGSTSSSSSSSSSATSGINDLIISESAPAPSVVAHVNGSKLSHASSSLSLPLNLNANSKLNNSSSSSYKEIMDFFQQTGGKGYILVEKKRQRDPHSDNLTLDSDQNRDDDLTNEGPTRLNITSDSFFLPQLNLLEQGGRTGPLTNSSSSNSVSKATKSQSSNNIPTDLLYPLESPDFEDNSEIDEYDTGSSNSNSHGQTNVNNESVQKHINSFNVNHIPSHSDKRQNSNSKTAQIQTTAPSTSTSSGSNVAVAESSINNSTTTDRPSSVDHPVTQVTQLTTLFEPVTPGKPVIFATTPSATTLNGSTFHPHHNYYAHTSPKPSPQYPSFIPLPQRGGSAPTLNSFLDSIDESLLLGEDDPIETEGDLNASESQQVRSIAITVTPPPSLLVSTTPAGKPSKHKSTLTQTTARTTTTEKPVSPITINPAFLVPVTKKATADASKRRPAPVYMGNKKTTEAPVAGV